jgi:hypothetical protein
MGFFVSAELTRPVPSKGLSFEINPARYDTPSRKIREISYLSPRYWEWAMDLN